MPGNSYAARYGSDPVSVFLLNPMTWLESRKFAREGLDLQKRKMAVEERQADTMYGRDTLVPHGSPYALHPSGGKVMVGGEERETPGIKALPTQGHIPGYYERQVDLKGQEIGLRREELGVSKGQLGVQRGQLGVQQRLAGVQESAADRARQAMTVASSQFTKDEVEQRIERLVEIDGQFGTRIAQALDPIIGRFRNFVGRGTKLEAFRGLKLLLANPENKQKLIARLERAKSKKDQEANAHIDELIRWVANDRLADELMPYAAAHEGFLQQGLDIERAKARPKGETGKLTELQKNEALAKIEEHAYKISHNKAGESVEPDPVDLENARRYANQYGYDLEPVKQTQVKNWWPDKTEVKLRIVPMRKTQPGGLRVTGGPEVAPRKPGETIDQYLKRTAK
jgi:hypothetical protein